MINAYFRLDMKLGSIVAETSLLAQLFHLKSSKMSSKFRFLQNDEKVALAKKIPSLNFVAAIEPELKCVSCDALPLKHYTSGCRHLFCSDCFNDLRTQKCPTCGENLDKIKLRKLDIDIEKRIFSQRVHCPNRKHGCQEAITLSNILEHERHCPFPLVTTVTNGTANLSPLTEAKESVQRLHEGMTSIIKEKSANKLREEFLNKYEEWTQQTVEQLQADTKNMENAFQNQIEQLEQRFRQEMLAVETKQIHDKSLQLKADFSRDLTNVEENAYAMNEKLTDRIQKQEEAIENMKQEIEIISAILRNKESCQKSNDDINVLVCGQSSLRTDFVQALANYFTFKKSQSVEEGGLIQLNPVYTVKKTDGNDQTHLYQFPVDDSRWLRIVSWENPSPRPSQNLAFHSNYHEESQQFKEFELLENPIFSILENQLRSLNAIVFLLNRSNSISDVVENGYFRLLHYIDRQCFEQNVKFVFVDDEENQVNRSEAVDFLKNATLVMNDQLQQLVRDENIFWINLQPYKAKTSLVPADMDESKWQNSVIESQRLVSSLASDAPPSSNDNSSSSFAYVVNSILATAEAIKAIHKLTRFYHESIVNIICNTEMANEMKSDIEDIDQRLEQVKNAWFKRDEQIASNTKQRERLVKDLEKTQSGIKSTTQMLEKERDNIAILIARLSKYFDNCLVFQRSYLDEWLWRYMVGMEDALWDGQDDLKNKGDGWLSTWRSKSSDSVSKDTKLTAHGLWSKLKLAVDKVECELQLADDDGTIEEGFRIGNHVQRLLDNINSHA